MKFNTIKISVIITILLITYVTDSYTQSNSHLLLSVRIRYNQIGQIDPLRFQAIIMNTEDRDLNTLGHWPVISVEYRGAGTTEWKPLVIPYLKIYALTGSPSSLSLRAGEAKLIDFSVLHDSDLPYREKGIIYYFNKYGEYTLRAKYRIGKEDVIFSNEAVFRIVPYEGPDAAAYEWLKDKYVPHFMYEMSLVHESPKVYTDKDALELIEKFPESKFAVWAKLYLGKCYTYSFCRNKERKKIYDPEKAAEFARELADSEDPDIQKEVDNIFEKINLKRPPEKHLKRRRTSYKQSDLNLSLSLRIRNSQIGLIDVLRFQAIIRNTGTDDLKLLAPWTDRRYMSVEYMKPAETEWKQLEVPYLNRRRPVGDIFPLNIRAGETKTADLTVLRDPKLGHGRKKFRYYFDKYGEYKIRAKYEPKEGEMMFSDETAIRVVPYKGPDAEAYEWLRQKIVPHFIYELSLVNESGRGSYVYIAKNASELNKRFPESRFAAWAKLYLGKCHVYGYCLNKEGKKAPDFDKAAEFAHELADSENPDIQKGVDEILTEIKRARSSKKSLKKK